MKNKRAAVAVLIEVNVGVVLIVSVAWSRVELLGQEVMDLERPCHQAQPSMIGRKSLADQRVVCAIGDREKLGDEFVYLKARILSCLISMCNLELHDCIRLANHSLPQDRVEKS